MAAHNTLMTGDYFDKAVIIVRRIAGKDFCQAIILSSGLCVSELQIFLDCSEGLDFFSMRSVDHDVDELGPLMESYGDEVRTVTIYPFEEVSLKIASFHGNEKNLIEISEVRILAKGGGYVTMSPDPERIVADQMCLTSEV